MSTDEWQAELARLEAEQSRGFVGRLVRLPRRYFYAGIGAASLAAEKVEEFRYEKVERNIDRLEERGHAVRERRLQDVSDAAEMSRGMAVGVTQQTVGAVGTRIGAVTGLARNILGVASASDVDAINHQLDDLNQRLDDIPIE
jgi:hypothetical protein